MASIHGIAGSIESWTNNSELIATGAAVRSVQLNLNGQTYDATLIDQTAPGFMEMVEGLRTWSGTITSRISPAISGVNRGAVAFATGYVVRAHSWTMNMAANAIENPSFTLTGNWLDFLPGPVQWSGSYSTLVDDTTLISAGANFLAGAPAAATFTYDSQTTTDKTLGGDIIVTGHNPNVAPGQIVANTVSFNGSDTLTGAGSDNPPFNGAVQPVVGALSGTFDGTRGFSGDAFWTSVNMSVPYNGIIEMTIGFQGTGALVLD